MRGTEFVILEIVWWMAAAAGVGGVIGWLLRGWRNARIDSEWLILVASLRDRVAGLEGAGDATAADEDEAEPMQGRTAAGESPEPNGADDEEPAVEPVISVGDPAGPPIGHEHDEAPPDVDETPSEIVSTAGMDDPGLEGPELVVELTDAAVGPADPFAQGDPTGVEEDELESS